MMSRQEMRRLWRATQRAALLLMLLAASALLGGCAALWPGDHGGLAPPATAVVVPAAAGADSPTPYAVAIDVEAPPPLRVLLERHLDLVRLGRAAPADVEDGEWSRLIDATPAQVAGLLQTEGYFNPKVSMQREASADGSRTERVRVRVEPGRQARIGRVTVLAEGELDLSAEAGDAPGRTADRTSARARAPGATSPTTTATAATGPPAAGSC